MHTAAAFAAHELGHEEGAPADRTVGDRTVSEAGIQ